MAGYHFIRSSQKSTGAQPVAQEMQAQGRRPIYGSWGNVTYASTPGAPASPRDSMSGLGITSPIGSPAHDAAWNNFFSRNTTPAAPAPAGSGDVSADETFGGGSQSSAPPVTAQDHVTASVAGNTSWLQGNGITIPPPPTPRASLYPTGTNQMQFPTGDPAAQKSQFTAGGSVDPVYAANVDQFNKRLYAPADTQQGSFPQQPQSNTSSSGWVTTGSDALAAIRQRFGMT